MAGRLAVQQTWVWPWTNSTVCDHVRPCALIVRAFVRAPQLLSIHTSGHGITPFKVYRVSRHESRQTTTRATKFTNFLTPRSLWWSARCWQI